MHEKPPASRDGSFVDWVRSQIASEGYWFQRMDRGCGLTTPGWSDPRAEKLPYFGLPERMQGMRVLDVGCAEGFFSFEAERRGAKEVIAIDVLPDSIRRFGICRSALGARATAYLCNVYELGAKAFGTFDMVFFFGVLYHLRNRSSPWKECSAFVPVRSCCKPRRTRCPVPSPVSRSVARATAGRREGSMVLSR